MGRASWIALWLQLAVLLTSAVASTADSEPLVIIAHPSTQVKDLELAEVKALFTVSQKRWSNGVQAIPFNFPPGNDTRTQFDAAVLGLDPERVAKFWIDQRIRGRARPPRHVSNELLMAKVIAALPGSVGYVHRKYVPNNVLIVAYVIDGDVVPASGKKEKSK